MNHDQKHNRAHKVNVVAATLDLSVRKTYQLIAAGELGSIKIDGCRRVTDRQLDTFLEKCEAASEAAA